MKKILIACALTSLVFLGISIAFTQRREKLTEAISLIEVSSRRVVSTRGPQELREWADERMAGSDDLLVAMEQLSVLTRSERRQLLDGFIDDVWLARNNQRMEEALAALSAKEDPHWFLHRVLESGKNAFGPRYQQDWPTCAMRSLLESSPEEAIAFAEKVLEMEEAGDPKPPFRFGFLILNHYLKTDPAKAADWFARRKLGFGFGISNEAVEFESTEAIHRFQIALLEQEEMEPKRAEGTMAYLAGRAFELGGIEAARVVLDRVAPNDKSEQLMVDLLSHGSFAGRIIGKDGGRLILEMTGRLSGEHAETNVLGSFAYEWAQRDFAGFTGWVRGLERGKQKDDLLGVLMSRHVDLGDRSAFGEMLELVADPTNVRVRSALGRFRNHFSEEQAR